MSCDASGNRRPHFIKSLYCAIFQRPQTAFSDLTRSTLFVHSSLRVKKLKGKKRNAENEDTLTRTRSLRFALCLLPISVSPNRATTLSATAVLSGKRVVVRNFREIIAPDHVRSCILVYSPPPPPPPPQRWGNITRDDYFSFGFTPRNCLTCEYRG